MIKSYDIFLEAKSDKSYSIYDWADDLKRFQWSKAQHVLVNESSLKKWSDHFIGNGWYDKIKNRIDKIWSAFEKVDVIDINYRMCDVYDQIPFEKEKYTSYCIVYGDYINCEKENRNKYNGYRGVSRNLDPKQKIYIIVDIIKEIVHPTLSIGYPSINIRKTKDEIYVTEDKYKCENFNIDNYSIKEGDNINDRKDIATIITSYNIDDKRKYSSNKILEMNKPAILVVMGGHSNAYLTGKMNLKKLEADIDEVLLSILPTINYEEVLFDVSRFDRQFSDDTEIYDYTFKILLKLQ